MKFNLLILILITSFTSYSQKIVLDEDFKDNKNKWQIELYNSKERANISGGRYDLYTIDCDNWHFFTISNELSDKNDFIIETVITKLPREFPFQKINVQTAKKILSNSNYTKKSNNLIFEGLRVIEHQQKKGVRYNLNLPNEYQTYYQFLSLDKKELEALSNAMGFIAKYKNEILYSDEIYGITWGGNSNKNLFAFNIYPELKSFIVASSINGIWTDIIGYTKNDKILSGNATNKLSIVKVDDYLNFYINDESVGKAPFQQFFGKDFGFFVGPETHISVDNLKIISNEPNTDIVISSTNNLNDNYKSSGTGFLISSKGYFVTNNHVIDGANEIWIEANLTGKKETLKAKVAIVDKNNDLAILKIDNPKNLPLPSFGFKPQTIDVGTNVFAMGYPMLSYLGEELKITDGIISSKTGFKGDISSYQISAPLQPGNSGGALFDKKGNLVGITNAGIPDAQNVGYAIKASYLQNLIELLPEKVDLQLSNKVEDLSFTDQIKELTKFVVIVKVK